MRLAYLSSAVLGTSQANGIQVMRMCDGLVRAGGRVTLFAAANSAVTTTKGMDDLRSYYGVGQDFEIQLVSKPQGVGRHVYGAKLALQTLRGKFDATFGRFLPATALATAGGVQSIFECHQPIEGVSSLAYVRLMTASKHFRGTVAITQSLKKHLTQNAFSHISNEKIVVEPDAVDLAPFNRCGASDTRRASIGVSADQLLVAYSGSFYPGKGLGVVRELSQRLPSVQFLVVGGSESEVAAERAKMEARDQRNVHFTGYVNPSLVPSFLMMADVLLLPNQERVASVGGGEIGKWTSPLKLFEYMAARKPIVASDLPVLREVLNSENSVLVPPTDITAWANALVGLGNSCLDRRKLAEKARSDVETYTWSKRAERCLEMFDHV